MAVIECPHCGAPVHVDNEAKVRTGHSDASGRPREWVIREAGDEVHRCPDSHPSALPKQHGPSPRTQEAVHIIAVQLGSDEDEALTQLRDRAKSLQYRAHDYALFVIEGMVRFDSMHD
jgi:hypothetical protein